MEVLELLAQWINEEFAISLDEITVDRGLEVTGFRKLPARLRHCALAHHVHRPAQLRPCVIVITRWHKTFVPPVV